MAEILIEYVFSAGFRLIDQCEEAKQCEVEVVRIAVRTQNVLATLRDAQEQSREVTCLEVGLLELKSVFEDVHALVNRCSNTLTLRGKASMMVQRGPNPNRAALIKAEKRLERVTQDLGLPMLTDIKRQLNRMREEAQKAQVDMVASTERDKEVLAEVIRTEIQRAMGARGKSGITISEIMDSEIANLADDPARGGAGSKVSSSSGAPTFTKSKSSKFNSLAARLGRVEYDYLEEGGVLGEGTFGTVVSGTYRGRDVAVKKARGAVGSTSIMESFRQESEIHFAMRHPKIVEVIAFGLGDDIHPPCLVMERMQETLYDFLGVQGFDLPLMSKVTIAQDVCEGMRFLHSRGILHRDLKSLNVLLDEACSEAKISDFGLAKVNSSIATSTGFGVGNHKKVGSDFWMAPEVHDHHRATRAADVFSLHVVMWEIFSQQRAGSGKPIGERLLTNPDAHLPLEDLDWSNASENTDYSEKAVRSQVTALVRKCGSKGSRDRPEMEEICSTMSAVLGHLKKPQEHPLSVVPLATDRRQPQLEALEEFKPKRSSNPHGTKTTAGLSTISRSSMPSVMPSTKSTAPPPLPPRRFTVGGSNSQSRVGSWNPSAASVGSVGSNATWQDDRSSLHALLLRCSPQPPSEQTFSKKKAATPLKWKFSAGWGTPCPMSCWYGVSTRNDVAMGIRERVTRLELVDNGLSGELPDEFYNLDWLVSLDLHSNMLTGGLSSSIGSLRSLQKLDLSGNKIIGPIPRQLGDLSAIETIELQDNGLTGAIPAELGRLKALKTLRLWSNHLNGEIPEALAGLDQLEEISLYENELTGGIPAVSGCWPILRILNLSANNLTGWIPPPMVEMKNLRELRLDGNRGITGGIPPWLGRLQFLEVIDLSATQLGGTIPRELGYLRSLQHLSLHSNNLTGTIPVELLELPKMVDLKLKNNNLDVKKGRFGGTKNEIKKILPEGCKVKL